MDSSFTLSVDWRAFTVLASNPQETMRVLGGDWSKAKGGFRGYPLSWMRVDGLRGVGKLGTNAPRPPNEIHVDLSGGLASALTLDQIRALLQWVHTQQGHVTRIDCGLDDRAGTVPVSTIRQAVAAGQCVTRAAQVRHIVSNLTHGTGATTGETMYFDSPQSQTLLRIYDKRLELQSKGQENWQEYGVRWAAKPATVNKELGLVRHSFNVAIREWEWCRDNPMQRVCMEKVRNEGDRWLSSDEEGRLLAHSAPWLQDIIVFALNTGMRRGEILNLQWQAIDLNRQVLVVMQSKNGEKRTVPLNGRLTELLKRKASKKTASSFVFASSAETLFDARHLTRAFRLAATKAALSDFRFHDLRHTFAHSARTSWCRFVQGATSVGPQNSSYDAALRASFAGGFKRGSVDSGARSP